MGVGSFAIFLLWGNIRLRVFCKKTGKLCFRILAICANGLSFFLISGLILVSTFIMLYSYHPEHIVTRNGIKIVASVHSFLDEQVYYYQYKNWFFYGKELDYEDYGSEDQKQSKPILLNIEAIENSNHESIFSVPIEDFISSYNSLYQQEHHTHYLTSSSEWTQGYEKTPYYQYNSVCYLFSADKQVWSMPTISIYTPKDGNGIYEIKLTFDDHSYRESFYEAFKNMCFYSLKVFLPKLSTSEIDSLYENLYTQTNENFFDEYDTVHNIKKDPFHIIYTYGGIGFYGYYGAGTANICIIPITDKNRKNLEKKEIQIHKLESINKQ